MRDFLIAFIVIENSNWVMSHRGSERLEVGKEFEATFELRLIMKRSQLCKDLGKSIPGRGNKCRGCKVMSI